MDKKKTKKTKKTLIGGQAVIEGVMMRGRCSMATAVRDSDGNIQIESKRLSAVDKKPLFLRLPIVRGVVNFINSMIGGTQTLMRSAEVFGTEDEEPSKFEKWLSEKLHVDIMSVVLTVGLILGLALAVFLFVMLPQWATNGLNALLAFGNDAFLYNLIEGLIRIVIFVCYILLTSLMPDIKRTYMYHGAEHKTITCYEKGLQLTPQNAKTCTRVHNRCGTTFLFFVMLVSILVFSVVNSFLVLTGWKRMLLKIALLPLVAGLSYELLRALAKTECFIFYPLKAPGLLLQRITTREPDEGMLEVAIAAFNTVLMMDEDESIAEQSFVVAKKVDELLKDILQKLTDGGVTEQSDAEWIVSISTGIKRSQLAGNKEIVSPLKVKKALKMVEERITGRPLWYIVGDTDFYGYRIKVDERVLIPRCETEELVSFVLEKANDNDKILDMCTGSGAIAIALASKTKAAVTAVDISSDALDLAKENAKINNVDIRFIESDLFEKVQDKFSIIVSNPPYIENAVIDTLSDEVKNFEPHIALDGGGDGLDFYKKIIVNADKYLFEGGVIYFECGINQAGSISSLLSENGYKNIEIRKDLSGIERMVKAEKI